MRPWSDKVSEKFMQVVHCQVTVRLEKICAAGARIEENVRQLRNIDWTLDGKLPIWPNWELHLVLQACFETFLKEQ